MLGSVFKKVFGSKNEREIKKLKPYVEKINNLEEKYEKYTHEQLKDFTFKWLEHFKSNNYSSQEKIEKILEDILPDAFAIVREASKRTLKMRHFDVQLIGGIVLHQGKIAEMKTGEGKTLVSTLAAYLNALVGKGVHIVTVNDYLAKRDSEWMGVIYNYLGMDVGTIVHDLDDDERKRAYNCHITYGTNNEFGFDYLRDNMKFDLEDYVQREHYYAIVDEVDSILIDEARTPLIISGPTDETTDKYVKINKVVKYLNKETDFTIDEKSKTVSLTEEGVAKLEKLLNQGNLYDPSNIETLHHVHQALKANVLFKRDVDYVVKDGEVLIVDEFTGRLMPGRRYSDGLHQALEAKEGVTVEKENQTLASITFQNYFRMYTKLSGMTGTADTEAVEFNKIYGLDVIVIPTNKPMIRKDYNDVIYKTEKEKFKAVIDEIVQCHKNGQPVLVGTISIEKSEVLNKMLARRGIKHNVLNAKHHENEAFIIAQAGRKGAVTISTNMAGRGTDIVLGGNPEMMLKEEMKSKGIEYSPEEYEKRLNELKKQCEKEKEEVLKAGGLHVLGTERHESRRIDNQLRGRSGRQGDPGSSRFFVSLEDDLMRIFGGERISSLMDRLKIPEGEPIENALITKSIENAQKKVEGHNFEIRKQLLEYDDVMNKQRETIYSLRKDILTEGNLKELMSEFIEEYFDSVFYKYVDEKLNPEEWDFESLIKELENDLTIKFNINFNELQDVPVQEVKDKLLNVIFQEYEDREKTFGEELIRHLEKLILLHSLDTLWKEHLLNIDLLKEGIGLRGYAQQDPVRVYQKEAYELFLSLIDSIKLTAVKDFFRIRVVTEDEVNKLEQETKKDQEFVLVAGGEASQQENKKKPKKRQFQKVGRNDPCPCGSGKKYKKCCWAKDHGK
jgi:preprotein translocase subunit SecA